MTERTLIILKPDALQRSLAGEIISRFEEKGFKLVASKLKCISKNLAAMHYAVHNDQPFFDRICDYLSSSASLIMVWEGNEIIALSRKLIGATFAKDAQPGTIRGDFSCSERFNLVHGSDSVESSNYEIGLYFNADEITEYELGNARWLADAKPSEINIF